MINAPRGAGSRFMSALLCKHYNIESGYWYNPSNNEYHHNRASFKVPGNKQEAMCWYKNRWVEGSSIHLGVGKGCPIGLYHIDNNNMLFDEDYRYDEFYNIIVDKDSYWDDHVTKLAVIKLFTSGYSQEVHHLKMKTTVNYNLYKEFLIFLKSHNINIPPINRIFTIYFLEHENWDFEELVTIVCRYLQKKTYDCKNKQYLKHINRNNVINIRYDEWMDGNTGTFLDQYSDDITEYHNKNLELINNFEKIFPCI